MSNAERAVAYQEQCRRVAEGEIPETWVAPPEVEAGVWIDSATLAIGDAPRGGVVIETLDADGARSYRIVSNYRGKIVYTVIPESDIDWFRFGGLRNAAVLGSVRRALAADMARHAKHDHMFALTRVLAAISLGNT